MVCIPPGSSDVEDPSLGVTDGGILGRGLPSQGSLVDVERAVIISFVDGRELLDLVVGHPGSLAKEEANLVELNSHIPHASKSENMKANKSFMVFHSLCSFTSTHFSLLT